MTNRSRRLLRSMSPLLIAFLLCTLGATGHAAPSTPGQATSAPGPRDILYSAGDPILRQPSTSAPTVRLDLAADFVVNWNPAGCWGNTSPWPRGAQTAFRHALTIWGSLLVSDQPIVVDACWRTDLPAGHIAEGGAISRHRDFANAPLDATWYPAALAHALAQADLNDHDGWDYDQDGNDRDSEAGIEFNRSSSWYFGTDGHTPGDKLDLVSTALHELAHGLGFMGFAAVDTGDNSCGTDTAGDGCLGWWDHLAVYDRFTEDGAGFPLADYVNPSAELGRALSGRAGGVFFNGPASREANGGAVVPLYAPDRWSASSYSHLSDVFNATANSLMTRSQYNGIAEHHPGPVALGVLQDMGWTVVAPESAVVHLPLLFTPQPPSTQWVTLLYEDFEGDFPGSAWVVVDEDADEGSYHWGQRSCRSSQGSSSGWSVGAGDSVLSCRSDYPADVYAWMVFGPFSLADATAAELTFDWWSETRPERDHFAWGASLDDYHYHGGRASGDHSAWTRGETLDLSHVPVLGDLLGEKEVWIGFSFKGNESEGREGSYVDNILLRKRVGGAPGVARYSTTQLQAGKPEQTQLAGSWTRNPDAHAR